MLISEILDKTKNTAAKVKQFEKKNIVTVKDLVKYPPAEYVDCRAWSSIGNGIPGRVQTFVVKVISIKKRQGKQKAYVEAFCSDGKDTMNVRWFNTYIYNELLYMTNRHVLVAGMLERNEWGNSMANPCIFTHYEKGAEKIYPLYRKIAGMGTGYYESVLGKALAVYVCGDDILPEGFRKAFDVMPEEEMIKQMHGPESVEEIRKIGKRMNIEKMYLLAEQMAYNEMELCRQSRLKITKAGMFDKMKKLLPFELTPDQDKVIRKLVGQAADGVRISSLVQGDVGSGKTVVAIILMFVMSENGYQSVLMAPTGVLARQHYMEVKGYADALGVRVGYLASDTKAAERKKVLAALKNGEVDVLVGTHSVISESVGYNKLGMIIVDEEHKFGVRQRERLRDKSKDGVHYMALSATPIPRTLATTLYGNTMDVYSIESMPNGRKPVRTAVVHSFKPMFDFMSGEIRKGHQAYIVCPLIENRAEKEDGLYSVEEMKSMADRYYKNTGIKTEVITGKMKDGEKNAIIKKFVNGDADILIATTIIEVGVNVPNTTVISIINAERFGLSGLHQLRGRVGRNSLQSYCMLVSEQRDNPRLDIMCRTTNGFKIAEADLEMRGSGDIMGVKQSGSDEKVELMLRYPGYFNSIKEWIKENANRTECEKIQSMVMRK